MLEFIWNLNDKGPASIVLRNYSTLTRLFVQNTLTRLFRVEDIKIAARYPGIMNKAPAMQPWGLRVLYLSDPSGVLWHFAERPRQ